MGRHLLPRHHVDDDDLVQEYHLRDYLTELKVLEKSPLIGKTLTETQLGETFGLNIVGIIRDRSSSFGFNAQCPYEVWMIFCLFADL